MKPFVVNVADLLHRPGARRRETLVGPLGDVEVAGARVPADAEVVVDAVLEWVSDGVLATGEVRAPWAADCSRCLGPATGDVTVEFRELFASTEAAPAGDEETYPLRQAQVDFARLAREALLSALPMAPLCRRDCLGLCAICGGDRNRGECSCEPAPPDPRWDALAALRSREEPAPPPD